MSNSKSDGAGTENIEKAVVAGGICSVLLLGAILTAYRWWKKTHKSRAMEFCNMNECTAPSYPLSPFTSDADFRKDALELCNGPKVRATRIVLSKNEVQVFTYKQLYLATNNFSLRNVIGMGSFGHVYKGILPDGRVAAVKELDKEGKQGEREFRVEVDILSRLHSPYLLQLLGYCADRDHRILVYEYMPNGNLQQHIYTDGSPGTPPILDWPTRLRIALDAARGLEFLHEGTNPPIMHRDFKTSNILLDENYKAKISDFGLAKLGSEKLNGQVSTRVLGTTGYVAPEYALTGHLTVKSDVYSFGVVLLELVTGRMPIDMKRPRGEGILVSWALPYLSDTQKVTEIVDPALEGQYSKKELIQVASIAAMCVHSDPEYRPLMTDVVQTLAPYVKHGTKSRPGTSPNFQPEVTTITFSSIDSGSSDTSHHSPV